MSRAGRTRAARLLRRCVASVVVCALPAYTAAAAGAAGGHADRASLCGIVRPLDELLGCRHDAREPAPPREAAPASTESTRATAGLEPQPPVVSTAPRYVDDLLLLRFRKDVSAQEKKDALAQAGVTAVRRIANLGVTVVRMPPERRDAALAQLRQSPAVAHVERDAVLERLETTPNDTDWSAQWGLRRIGLPAAWDRTRGSSSVLVAVLDTGVDGDLPDLRAAVVPGYNTVAPQLAAADDNGHGTSVAGIIAARTNNREGIAGICWACSVLPIKVLGADGTGDTALVAAGIVRAADAGARVISMSLGGTGDDQTLEQAVAYATGKGAILVAAAGNNGVSTPFYPAAISGVVSVAATDQNDRLYSWSNFGSWVALAAPGCNPAPETTGGYAVFCGTSSATPVVAGVIALQLSEAPNASRDTIVAALERTATPLGGAVRYGRIDGEAALAALASPATQTEPGARPAIEHTSTLTLRGALRNGAASFRRALSAGSLTATLRSPLPARLTLTIRSPNGKLMAQARGRRTIRAIGMLPAAGRYTFTIRGPRTRAAVVLTLAERTPA